MTELKTLEDIQVPQNYTDMGLPCYEQGDLPTTDSAKKAREKSLKEIGYPCSHRADKQVNVKKLRAAAVNWIKEFEKIEEKAKSDEEKDLKNYYPDTENPYALFTCTEGGHWEVINFLKHFFNLTEGDLK